MTELSLKTPRDQDSSFKNHNQSCPRVVVVVVVLKNGLACVADDVAAINRMILSTSVPRGYAPLDLVDQSRILAESMPRAAAAAVVDTTGHCLPTEQWRH